MRLVFTILCVMAAGTLVVIMRGVVARAQSTELPTLVEGDLPDQGRVTAFATAFIERDSQARQLLNPSNKKLFAKGYRPNIGVPHDPEAAGRRSADITIYFTRKLYLDLKSIHPISQLTFRSFVDKVGGWADETLICAGTIAVKYNLNLTGRFVFETELAKIPDGPEREEFQRCWLNDSILGTELRMLAWIYEQLYGAPYVNPEKR